MSPTLIWAVCSSLALLITIVDLCRTRRQLTRAYTDPTYGILTRAGGEAAWLRIRRPVEIIFLDLDHIHDLNQQLGYAEVDRRIRAAILVRHGDLVMMRWFSGDEIVVVVPMGDGLAAAERLRQSLQTQGLSGTFGVVPPHTHDLAREVNRAIALVSTAKAANQRGEIHST